MSMKSMNADASKYKYLIIALSLIVLSLYVFGGNNDNKTIVMPTTKAPQSIQPTYKTWEVAQSEECEQWAQQLNKAYKQCHMKQTMTCASISDIETRFLMTRYISQQILANSYQPDGNHISCQNFKRALQTGGK